MKRKILCVLALGALSCASVADEQIATSAAPLEQFQNFMVQVKLDPSWDASRVELLAADAYYNCSRVEPYAVSGSASSGGAFRMLEPAGDAFLSELEGQILNTVTRWQGMNPPPTNPASTGNIVEDWYGTRKYLLKQVGSDGVDDVLDVGSPSGVALAYAGSSPTSFELALDTDIRTAPVNLCIAQQLRKHSPGSAAKSGIFLPEAEQRELLEIIRERSQIAMLQYGLFAAVLGFQRILGAHTTEQDRLPELSQWLHNLPSSVRARMGSDFATSAQLNAMATEEMAELLGRSRSRREPFGRVTTDRADTYWGTGSWFQRELALLFGGDPLAMETPSDKGAPWKGLVPTPGALTTNGTWPTAIEQPSFHTELLEPQVQALLQLARQRDFLTLELSSSDPCARVDIPLTAKNIYEHVEKRLHEEACNGPSGNACVWSLPSNFPDEEFWLLKGHRISRAHATTLAAWLAEALTFSGAACPNDPRGLPEGALVAGGVVRVNHQTSAQSQSPTIVRGETQIHLTPQSVLAARPLEVIGDLYARMTPLPLADGRTIANGGSDVGAMGFNGRCFGLCSWQFGATAEMKRIYGALPAHAAIRRQLAVALDQAPNEPFLVSAKSVGGLSTAVGGGPALSLHRTTTASEYAPTIVRDPAVSDLSCDRNGPNHEDCFLYALSGRPYAGDLAGQADGANIDSKGQRWTIDAAAQGQPNVGGRSSGSSLVEFDPIVLGDPAARYTFVLKVFRDGTLHHWQLIADQVRVAPLDPYDAVELSFGGTLGARGRRMVAPLLHNPVEPAYDGFDWETHWVPPLTAAFLGGDPNQPSVDPMLKVAEQSAVEAEDAINTAVTGLLETRKDQAQIAAAQAKSSQAIKQERDGLCGPSATAEQCTLATNRVVANISIGEWYLLGGPSNFNCSNPTTTGQAMDCLLQRALQSVEATQVTLAGPVDLVKVVNNAPSFSEYSGGSLQAAFIEQWRAIRSLGGKIRAVQTNTTAAKAASTAVESAILAAQITTGFKCIEGIAFATAGGFSSGFANASFDAGPLMAALADCALSLIGLDATVDAELSKQQQAYAGLAAALSDMSDFLAALQQSSAKIESLSAQAKMGQARAELDADLAKSTSVTSFPLYRNFRDADLWRAKATVESARRYALAARRALEARYVVDLTRLDQKETFVSAPSIWADDIYGYDLSLPSSVGLTLPTTDQKDPNAIYKSVIKDYVANLRGFMNGFAASRPSAVAQDDIDVINLSGFAPFGNDKESPGAWQLLCGTTWVSLDAYKSAFGGWNCGTSTTAGPKATRARVGFTLDPWGRLNGAIGNEPYTKRYNTRWTKVALNVVGTGVKDCSLAVDPLACYANSTVRYNLTHVTPTWTTDYDGLWREQDVPLGQIEGGKGLAVELFLNPLKDGWNTQFISAVARTEYLFRPVGGAYNLEFEVTPEVMLQRIERMQLLVGTSAWVKQK